MVNINDLNVLTFLIPTIINNSLVSRVFMRSIFPFSIKLIAQNFFEYELHDSFIDGHAFPDIGGAGVRLYEVKKDNHLEYVVVEFEKGLMLGVFTFDNLEDAIAKKIEVWTVSYEMKFSEN